MGILTSTGLPLLTSTGVIASRAGAAEIAPVPVPKPQPEPGEITLRGPTSSIAYRGVTFNFSRDIHWYESANGDPVVISHRTYMPSPVQITSMSPASAVIANHRAHGAMRNPHPVAATTGAQGFDGFIGVGGGQSASTGYTPYSAPLNVDPGATGSPITINPGDKFCILKSVRDTTITVANTLKVIDRYVPLTIMDSLPPSAGNWYRPAVSLEDANRAWLHRRETVDANLGVFRDLAAPSGAWSVTTSLDDFETRKMYHPPFWCSTHDPGTRFLTTGEPGNYSRDYSRIRCRWLAALHINPGGNQTQIDARRELAHQFAQWAIDIDGAHREGIRAGAGAGHHHGVVPFYFAGAFLHGDTAMLARARAHGSNTVKQMDWIDDQDVGWPFPWYDASASSGKRLLYFTYQRSDIGVPEWRIGPDVQDGNANLHASYRDVQFTTLIYEMLSICLLRNGFGTGMTGEEAVGNGPYSTNTRDRSALAYLDRLITFDPWRKSNQGNTGESVAMYNAWRGFITGQPRWTGRPDVPDNPSDEPASGNRQVHVNGVGSGQIGVRFDWLNYSTQPVLERQVQVSMDAYTAGNDMPTQFVDATAIDASNTVGTAGTKTLVGFRPGTVHQVRWRQRNASGWSRWTGHWELSDPSGSDDAGYKAPRNRVTTPGTSSGGVTNVVRPAILHKPYPGHRMPLYEPVTDASDVLTFYAGMGYWRGGSGALSPSAYQWQRDTGGGWANISGATGVSYTRQQADAGTDIRCLVTIGGTQVVSSPVSVPAANPTVGALIDFDFSVSSFFDWPTFKAALDAADSSNTAFDLVYYPYVWLTPEFTPGVVHIKKEGSSPRLDVLVSSSAPIQTYNWEVEFGGAYFPVHDSDYKNTATSYTFQIRDGSGKVRGDADITLNRSPGTLVHKAASGRFAVTAGNTAVRLYIATNAGAAGAGAGAGGAVLSRIKIWKA